MMMVPLTNTRVHGARGRQRSENTGNLHEPGRSCVRRARYGAAAALAGVRGRPSRKPRPCRKCAPRTNRRL